MRVIARTKLRIRRLPSLTLLSTSVAVEPAAEAEDDEVGNGESAPAEPGSEMPAEVIAEPTKPEPRRGWWQRLSE